MRWILVGSFLAFAVWTPEPDELEERGTADAPRLHPTIAFFVADIGDKTQVVTLLLAIKYSPW